MPTTPVQLTVVTAAGLKVRVHVETTGGIARCVGLDIRGFEGETGDMDNLPRPIRGRPSLEEITTVRLRELSVPRMLAEACANLAQLSTLVDAPNMDEVRAALSESPRRRYDADHFAEVARVYSENVEYAPTLAVKDHFKISRTAAAKQVARCREMGLLGPARQGRAGGARKVNR